jgi:hypothetical protein
MKLDCFHTVLEVNMEMQKCLHLSDALEKKTCKIAGEYRVTEKLDGWWIRMEAAPGQGWTSPISSANRHIPSLDFVNLTDIVSPTESMIVIAEATHPDYPEFSDLNGRLNRKYDKLDGVVLNIHDIIYPKHPTYTAAERLVRVTKFINAVRREHKQNGLEFQLCEVPGLTLSSKVDDWKREFDKVICRDGEGVVCKRLDALYYPGKRNESLIKIKEEVTLDLLCIGITHGFGRKGEPSMTLDCKSSNDKIVTVVVPKDSDRLSFTEEPRRILQKVVIIKAMKRLEDSLREPRFKGIRHDKLSTDIDAI